MRTIYCRFCTAVSLCCATPCALPWRWLISIALVPLLLSEILGEPLWKGLMFHHSTPLPMLSWWIFERAAQIRTSNFVRRSFLNSVSEWRRQARVSLVGVSASVVAANMPASNSDIRGSSLLSAVAVGSVDVTRGSSQLQDRLSFCGLRMFSRLEFSFKSFRSVRSWECQPALLVSEDLR